MSLQKFQEDKNLKLLVQTKRFSGTKKKRKPEEKNKQKNCMPIKRNCSHG